ncbi:MAG: DUF4159 domain-containing protein, partial [Gammaproteobacteria bacterium]|nr:DUF4159 domain-containing protein [Gammaproteobacteria bacterium]
AGDRMKLQRLLGPGFVVSAALILAVAANVRAQDEVVYHVTTAQSLDDLIELIQLGTAPDPSPSSSDTAPVDRLPDGIDASVAGVDRSRLKTDQFTFVRISYSTSGRAMGNAWSVDYPEADVNFSRYLAQLTGLDVDPAGRVLELTDPSLPDYPVIYLVEGGRLELSDAEASVLRAYLLGGGFLIVDDFWGDLEWSVLAAQMAKAFPDRAAIDVWPEHEIFYSYFALGTPPGVPSLVSLMNPEGPENFADAAFRGLVDDDGRLMALFLHNMDFGDAWEHAEDPRYPQELAWGGAIAMGVNAVIYALTH